MPDDVVSSESTDVSIPSTPTLDAAPVVVGTPPPAQSPPYEAPVTPPPTTTPVADKAFSDFIPEAFKNSDSVKAALATENPSDFLFQRLSDLETSLSTMDRVPKADATPEQIKAWVDQVKPADVKEYGDIAPKLDDNHVHLKDMMNAAYSDDVTNTIKNAAQEVGIQPWQLKQVMDKVNESQLGLADTIHKQALESEQALNAEFNQIMTTNFGAERSKVEQVGKQFLLDHVAPELRPHLMTLPNEALALISSAAYNAHRKYGLEDKLPDANTMGLGDSKMEMDSAISEAMAKLQTMDNFSPQYEAQRARIKQLCDASAKKFGV